MIRYKFSRESEKEFTATLNRRVNAYFQENRLSRNANTLMILKTLMAFSIYLIPFGLILFAGISNLYVLFGLWAVMGFGKAFIGTSVMHDSIHGSYAKKKKVNWWLAASAGIIGADPTVWRIQHNVLHHSYTNIEQADEDIQPRYVMRFSPHQPRRWFHRYQYIYAMFFYSISTFVWILYKDYPKLFGYRNQGFIKRGKEFNVAFGSMLARKSAYMGVFMVLPMLLLPFSPGMVFLMFLTMHIVAGVSLSLIFQPAHVMPDSKFIDQEEEEINHNWTLHQLLTTTNFGTGNRLLGWFTGGLNFQIEHHLFPNVCHIHYPKLAVIVKQTAGEYNLPYYSKRTFASAVLTHFRMLRDLGRAN